jgi:DNA-directed RNA polymerase beta subunit
MYGMVADIIINPHAYPSRMTVGMLYEMMTGKAGSSLGKDFDATAFDDYE